MQPDEYKPLPPEAHAFLDGTLNADQEADFRRRLDRDTELRNEVENVRVALGLLKTLPVKDPGPQFAQRVLERVRDNELGDRARKRIRNARTPIWQHVAQVAAGAVAAAIVLALVVPSGRDNATKSPVDGVLFDVATVGASEDDLLPNLGEQYARYRQFSSHIGALEGADGDSQRLLIRAELDHAGLLRRNAWLAGQIGDLPVDRRREYQRFLDGLANAIEIIDRETTESAAEHRPMNLGLVQGALGAVRAPERLSREVYVHVRRQGGGRDGRMTVSPGLDVSPQLVAYAAVREAVYSNDTEATLAACRAYLAPYRVAGRFARPASITAIGCLLRLDRMQEAVSEYEQTFGTYGEKLTAADQQLLRNELSDAEFKQLQTARLKSRGE